MALALSIFIKNWERILNRTKRTLTRTHSIMFKNPHITLAEISFNLLMAFVQLLISSLKNHRLWTLSEKRRRNQWQSRCILGLSFASFSKKNQISKRDWWLILLERYLSFNLTWKRVESTRKIELKKLFNGRNSLDPGRPDR